MRIAVDAMGGDSAPKAVVAGGILWAVKNPNDHVVMVGDKTRIESELHSAGAPPPNILIVHASQVVEMGDHPVESLKRKPDSSIVKCAQVVKAGEADAFVAAGNTGAAVAASVFILGNIPGVRRPGIGVPFLTEKGFCIMIDAGANVACKAIHLFQYGLMASCAFSALHGVERPRVGLLNVGAEQDKGSELLKETQALLQKSSLNFVGNVEGQDLFHGACDVLVCDGFVGNVLLKFAEGLAELILRSVMSELKNSGLASSGNGNVEKAVLALKAKLDYSEYGGAQLLGVNGICMIGHGRSQAKAIANAIGSAAQMVKLQLNQKIVAEIQRNPLPA
jgi:glycerol-3-phosphate acyltransferase PlsX